MRRVGAVVAVSFLLLTALSLTACSDAGEPGSRLPRGLIEFETETRTVSVRVEIADTEASRRQGLMNRRKLAPDAGMAFVFPRPVRGSFWMKNTLIPLSAAFWDEAGRIVSILHMEPCRADPCPLYTPKVPYVGAVEVNEGFFEEHGIAVGDRVVLSRSGS